MMPRSLLYRCVVYVIQVLTVVSSIKLGKELNQGRNLKLKNSAWNGAGLSQDELLHFDECILVDSEDNIIGHASKYQSHLFSDIQPVAKLHRAFSVFLFNNDGKLLLQQRAKGKVTFPLVWTNTCCSHPLFGYRPNEADGPEEIRSGQIPGIRAAAIRKLEHELGIQSSHLDPSRFKFITRIHYCAKDSLGPKSGEYWGEHEIDYILFFQGDYQFTPNPEEVEECKYVTKEELYTMLSKKEYKWSPWFKAIADKFLGTWWDNLHDVLQTNKYDDGQTIHRL